MNPSPTPPGSAGVESRISWLAHLPVQNKLLLALGLLLLLVIGNSAVFFYVQGEQSRTRAGAQQANAVLDSLDGLMIEVLNQETGLRGYRLTADTHFLEPYRLGKRNFSLHVDRLKTLTASNTAQQLSLQQVNQVVRRWHDEVSEPTILLISDPATRAAGASTIGRGKQLIDQFRVVIGEMQQLETAQLNARNQALERVLVLTRWLMAGTLLLSLAVVLLAGQLLRRLITQPLVLLTSLMTRISADDHDLVVPQTGRRDEIGALARSLELFRLMVIDNEERSWVKGNAGSIVTRLQAAENRKVFASTLTGALSPLLDAGVAAFYLIDDSEEWLELFGQYGYLQAKHGHTRYRIGDGLVGQCARNRAEVALDSLPADYARIHSGTGEAPPNHLLLLPVQTQDRLLGVIEFGSFLPFKPRHRRLLEELLPVTALSLENLLRALRTQELLEESQTLTEELQASSEELRVQQEELRTVNESLHAKSLQLEQQSSRLIASEEELKGSNEELKLKSATLSEQKKSLEQLQQETQQKADELARASQYKSEFLANMSHELRTPLNSLLILSRGLADNEENHLSADEVESARVIHESGASLLRLINDILDLSKVEAGKMELVLEPLALSSLVDTLTRNFRHVAAERGLSLSIVLDPALPATIETDEVKLMQILNNLLSNAFKFTRQGGVTVRIGRPPQGSARGGDVALQVIDTGIGIPADKFDKIFQAFEQVDGSTSRQFGGTGLGLSIARGMAQLMSGDIRVESEYGKGTTFTLLVPEKSGIARAPMPAAAAPAPPLPVPTVPPPAAPLQLPDDRHSLKPGDVVILVVEDDPTFARILTELVRKKGYRVLFAGDGESGMQLAREFRPTGILLDVMLPGMDGFSVIERLKGDAGTRHIPVHFISATDEHSRGLDLGAVGFLTKPVTRDALSTAFERLLHFAAGSTRRVLVVDDDAGSRLAVRRLIAGGDVEVTEAASGVDALERMSAQSFDCIVLDLGMPDMNGFELLERIAGTVQPVPPVVVYSGRELSPEENLKLRQYTDSIVIKGARSPERLLDEVSLFLHSIRAQSGETTAVMPPRESDRTLSGRTVLLVDDDVRNIFALSKALRAKGLNVVMAQDGPKALRQLAENNGIELVLMDIMMPGMDGYQVMTEIRKNSAWRTLPILALTAKAMRGDREKCLEAGASDYLSKPIDLDKLFSMMRVWLSAQ